MTLLLALVFWLLRSPLGAAIRAIRDNEEAAESIGVRVTCGEAPRLRACRLRRGAGRRAVARDGAHLPAEGLFQPALDGLHDFHGAGRRARHVRGRDPRRGASSSASRRGSARRASGISSASARRRSSSRSPFRAASGAGSRTTRRCGSCRSATGLRLGDEQPAKPNASPSEGMHAARQDDRGDRDLVRHRRADRRTRGASGADVIGVDVREPARPMDAFIRADIGSPQGVAEIADVLPKRFDALCNVAGVSGVLGAAKTLAINFYGLRALTEAVAPRIREGGAVVNVASIAGYGWRANLERAKAFVAARRLSRYRPDAPERIAFPTARVIRCRRNC